MKTHGLGMATACAAVSLLVTATTFAQAPVEPAKGKAVLSSVQVTATVEKIDQKTREVTLKASDGKEYDFVVDEAAKNLPQVKKGDVVTITYTEALAYEVKKGGTAGVGAAAGAAAAPLGEKPAGVVGRKVTVTVTIVAIDPKAPSVTFKGPAGNTKTVAVKDPAKLKGVSVGDTVELTYAEAVALKVETAKK